MVLHHYNEKENRYFFVRWSLKNKLLNAFNQLDAIVVVADYWKDMISKFVDREKVFVIRNSFDIDFINAIVVKTNKKLFKTKYNIPDDKIIVYAGNALKEKGYRDVINLLNNKNYFIFYN